MTKEEVIRSLCRITALVYHSIGDYKEPSDGFCDLCPNADDPASFQHSGHTLTWLRQAAVEKLKREGYSIANRFDPETGEEINPGPLSPEEMADRRSMIKMAETLGALGKSLEEAVKRIGSNTEFDSTPDPDQQV